MTKHARTVALFFLLAAVASAGAPAPGGGARVKSLKITVLSTMLADGSELGEWGFAALVEADGHRILFDTGLHPDLVLKNARSLGVDLSTVPEVVLSHSHDDHTSGLMTLRDSVLPGSPEALARVHVAEGMFYPRHDTGETGETNPMIAIKPKFEATGGAFIVHKESLEIHPGVWLSGPVPRKYPERNWSGDGRVETPAGVVEDNIPEDMNLVIDTDRGLVIVTGCGHAGVVNIVDQAETLVRKARVHALVGGIHLFNASDETLDWTARMLGKTGVDNFVGAHCTGIETVYRMRTGLDLGRGHSVVGAVGATFELEEGIDPRNIAQ